MSSVAVIGPGAIGGVLAARLVAKTSHRVVVCARSALSALLVLDAPDGRIDAQVEARLEPAGMAPVDWVLACVKAHQTPSIASWLAALCGPSTRVAVLQNGVEHRERVGPLAGPAEVLPVVVRCPARALKPGHVIQSGACQLTVAQGSTAESFRALLEGSGVEVVLTDDFTTAAWRKLCSNSALDAVTVLTRQPLGVLLRPDIAQLVRGLFEESVAVARADGARLEPTVVDALCAELEAMARAQPEGGNSMLYDALAGKALEVDARGGAVVRFGTRLGVATPLNSAAVALLRALEAR